MKKINVLHVVSSLSYSSGVMSVIMNYYRNLDTNLIQFSFLIFQEFDVSYREEILELGGNITLISKPKLSFKVIKEFKGFFKENTILFDVIHNHEIYLTNIISLSIKKYGKCKLISHSHTTMFSDKTLNSIRNRILCLGINRNSDILLACSIDAGKSAFGKKISDNCDFHVLNNAIDVTKFLFNEQNKKNIQARLNIKGKKVIGHIGRFNEQKNHRFLINLFIEIHKVNKDVVLLLIGEGPLKRNIIEIIRENDLEEYVIILDPQENIWEFYSAMDIFVLPSLFEGLGIVLVEAQCNGLISICSDEVPKDVDLKTLSFVNLNDKNKWIELINNNINNLNRKIDFDYIKNKGYEISSQALKLYNIYYKLTRSDNCV